MRGKLGCAIGTFAVIALIIIFTSPRQTSPTNSETSNTGSLKIHVKDNPLVMKHLNLTIEGFEVSNSEGEWFEIPIDGGIAQFDLSQLRNITREVVVAELPAGEYTMVRMKILHANATLESGQELILRIANVYIDVDVRFEIENDKETIVLLDINVQLSPIVGVETVFHPKVKATVIPPS